MASSSFTSGRSQVVSRYVLVGAAEGRGRRLLIARARRSGGLRLPGRSRGFRVLGDLEDSGVEVLDGSPGVVRDPQQQGDDHPVSDQRGSALGEERRGQTRQRDEAGDRKSTRLNSSHVSSSY